MPIDEITKTLQGLTLPSLKRPSLGPADPPTLALVQFDLVAYAYSSIAFVRDLLSGLLVLNIAGNVAAVDLVIRSLFEWTMQASYVDQQNREPLKAQDYAACRAIMDRVQTGNGWVKRHGDKYWKPPFEDDISEGVRIKHLVKAYKAHQMETRKVDTVEDDYGYLSEHAHPNSFCFLDVTRRNGLNLEFVRPTPGTRNQGIVSATMLDWALCIYNILHLGEEATIRVAFVSMLKRVVAPKQQE
jgi:hypothetical protein